MPNRHNAGDDERVFATFLTNIFHISSTKTNQFVSQSESIQSLVDSMPDDEIRNIITEIGTIPESIAASSSVEKLYSKASDIVLARALKMLGLTSKALAERSDAADVIAQSPFHKYSLVADAKCFRLSRTAKNQKDFKISALSNWRGGENEYAVLVAPYFQYPKKASQIYKMALNENVCLLGWEQISLLLDANIKESDTFSLETIWNTSKMIARDRSVADAEKCFLPLVDKTVAKKIGIPDTAYAADLDAYKTVIAQRGVAEIDFCTKKIETIRQYSREKAINELIRETKYAEKIRTINTYISSLRNEVKNEPD